ncbi:MAG TPA: hypothetical protein VGL93_23180 [Streptosporangiaceae bacterium]|jgi:ribose 1,5-bisphosphokinase PhnN
MLRAVRAGSVVVVNSEDRLRELVTVGGRFLPLSRLAPAASQELLRRRLDQHGICHSRCVSRRPG